MMRRSWRPRSKIKMAVALAVVVAVVVGGTWVVWR